ncbi:MAG: TonB-dependent receptor, partial [Myxococcota bacterium]
ALWATRSAYAQSLDDVEVFTILGKRPSRVSGSAHAVSEEQLERYEYDDLERVLNKVPGVYVRGEDGFGLRPNIGLRGASSDRSSKITLMEDGVLFGPAPYSAPAAYYFPLITRMSAVEVFKGPSSILYGPNTIGGAINLSTARPNADGFTGLIDLAAGQFDYGKGHVRLGYGTPTFSVLLEGIRLQSTGFKELDGGGDTGFGKNDSMLKLRYVPNPGAVGEHSVELKLGYADEYSNETYLGLSAEDFAATPYRRYAASAPDRMDWERTQVQLDYRFDLDDFEFHATAYRHDFDRVWRRQNRFSGSATVTSLSTVINDPSGARLPLLQVLRGERDSADETGVGAGDLVAQAINARDFVSQGIELRGRAVVETGALTHTLTTGVRLHYDRIRRRQREIDFELIRATTVRATTDERIITWNAGESVALAAYANDEIEVGGLLLTPGLRFERIASEFRDRTPSNPVVSSELEPLTVEERTQSVLIPGLGAYYEILDDLGVLAGVHRGFSPAAPGQGAGQEVEPERSLNYEAGLRYTTAGLRAEVIGFFSDYENLLGSCTASSGCDPADLDRQFNAGEVFVYGLEAALSMQGRVSGFNAGLDGSLTVTQS